VFEAAGYLTCAVLIGAGATTVTDIWTVARKRLLGTPALDYDLVGRWLAYLARGRFRHDPIAASPPVRGERVIGWIAQQAARRVLPSRAGAARSRMGFSASASTVPAGQQAC
jgi:hypothetical protein